MLTPYERRLALSCLANATARLSPHDWTARKLVEWVDDHRYPLQLGDLDLPMRREDVAAEAWRNIWQRLREALAGRRQARPRADCAARRLARLAKVAGLSRADTAILNLLLRCKTGPHFDTLADALVPARRHGYDNLASPVLPSLLGVSPAAFRSRFATDAPLLKSGLVVVDHDGDFQYLDRLRRLVSEPESAGCDIARLLLGEARAAELGWADFDHIAEGRDHLERLLGGALKASAKGVNILVHGPPGTGKTAFCATLAARLGAPLYSVGEGDEEDGEPSRRHRLQDLRFSQRLLRGGAILLFDEMEDLLSGPEDGLLALFGRSMRERGADGSKLFMNRLLEEAPMPVLWTSNAARQTSPVILRRMMFALEMRPPPQRIRARIWSAQLARHGIAAANDDARRLAWEFEATPGVAAGATAAASPCGGDLESVRRGVASLVRVLPSAAPPQRAPERFDAALIRADLDAEALVEKLRAAARLDFSFCLQGPPGCGKSAFLRHLAEQLGLEAVQKRASDLLSPWVGMTERRIADAFAEARDAGSFLIFDEADSLLADRRLATRSWEIGETNEMLSWMESHPLPFACTTNFGEHLDPAALRRFTFKARLDYLDGARAAAAFRLYFAQEAPPSLAELGTLTPGDFAVVRRKAELLGLLTDGEALATMLRAECEAKPEQAGRIGFR